MQNVKLQIFRVILIFFFNPLVDDLEKCKNVVNKITGLDFTGSTRNRLIHQ